MKRKRELEVVAIPVPLDAKHPGVPNKNILPQHPFLMALIAPKGSGKTTLIGNLLDFYTGYFHVITILSPTIRNDEKWKTIKQWPLLAENVKLKKFMESKGQGSQNIIEAPKKDEIQFDPKVPDDHFISEYSPDLLKSLTKQKDEEIEWLESNDKTVHWADRWLIVYDDQVGSNLFSQRKDNPFNTYVTRMRHWSSSAIVVTQSYKQLPKVARVQCNSIILFEIGNEVELKDIFMEFGCGLKWTEWLQVFQYCTSNGEYDFMYINLDRPKKMRIMKNFDEIVNLE